MVPTAPPPWRAGSGVGKTSIIKRCAALCTHTHIHIHACRAATRLHVRPYARRPLRYTLNEFGVVASTLGAQFALKMWHGQRVGIWDTAGQVCERGRAVPADPPELIMQEKYSKLSSFYCRGAGAAMVCYDVTSA